MEKNTPFIASLSLGALVVGLLYSATRVISGFQAYLQSAPTVGVVEIFIDLLLFFFTVYVLMKNNQKTATLEDALNTKVDEKTQALKKEIRDLELKILKEQNEKFDSISKENIHLVNEKFNILELKLEFTNKTITSIKEDFTKSLGGVQSAIEALAGKLKQ